MARDYDSYSKAENSRAKHGALISAGQNRMEAGCQTSDQSCAGRWPDLDASTSSVTPYRTGH